MAIYKQRDWKYSMWQSKTDRACAVAGSADMTSPIAGHCAGRSDWSAGLIVTPAFRVRL